MQMRKHLRLTAALTAGCLVLGALPCSALTVSAADFSANYAEAMQKSLYFYECQQAGPLPDWNEVEWRADSTMTDEVTGGWYDAGDHVKFNLPMAYSASMLAWGLYQYPDGLEKTGEMETYVNNLSFVLDYLAACDEGDTAVYQVGNGQMDHTSNFRKKRMKKRLSAVKPYRRKPNMPPKCLWRWHVPSIPFCP